MITINYNKLKELYIFKSPDQIKEFIGGNIYTIQPLIDIHGQIPKYFEKVKDITLDVYADPSCTDDAELIVGILLDVTVDPDDAFARLDRFDDWFLEFPDNVRVIICVMVEW